MFVVISGTNRPDNLTHRLAGHAARALREGGQEVELLDLRELPAELFLPESYTRKPEGFARFQDPILETEGILTVVPEYNGTFPGALKYFLDMLRFPESLVDKPAAFVGLSAGPWGGTRAVEQLQTVFQYRKAHLFGPRLFVPGVARVLGEDGELSDEAVAQRLRGLVTGFVAFSRRLGTP